MSDEDSTKKFILLSIIVLAILIPAGFQIFSWINEIGLVEFSIYLLISVGSIISYKLFKFLNKEL